MSDFEQWLRRYRPVGPPLELHRFELRQYPKRARIVEWLPALATAALIVLFYGLGVSRRAELASRFAVPDDLRPVEQWLRPDDEGWR